MNDFIRWLAIFLFGNLSLAAFFVTLSALFPRRVGQTRLVADAMPGRAFAVGLVNGLFLGAIVFVLLALAGQVGHDLLRAALMIPALFFSAVLGVGVSFGLAGMVRLVGGRLTPAQSDLRQTIWGVLALSLGCSLPLVGWFGLLPYASLLGLGAFIIGFFFRERAVAGVNG
jgi:hypothetical protein